jgi:hypothetical protein
MLTGSLNTSVLLGLGLTDPTGLLSQEPASDHLASPLHDTASVPVLGTAAATASTDTLDPAHWSVNPSDRHTQTVQNGQPESQAVDPLQALQNFVPRSIDGNHGIHTQGNLVVNGGFEDPGDDGTPCTQLPPGVVPGWTTDDHFTTGVGSIDRFPGYIHSGNCAALMGRSGQTSDLSQTLNTTPGASYVLDFWIVNPTETDGTTDSFTVLFDGKVAYMETQQGTFAYKEALNPDGSPITVTASSDTAVLTYRARQDPDFWAFDDVSVTPA